MFYIVEHDTGVNQIIDIKGKANKYGKAKLFDSVGDALKWLSKHYRNKTYAVNNSIFGMMTSPFYEVKEATEEEVKKMSINALTVRRLANQRRSEQIRQVMARTITKPVRWVLCWGKMDYRTGKWEWKNEHSFENRTAALANKNSFLRYPVDDQNACYVVRRYEHGNQNTAETMEGLH